MADMFNNIFLFSNVSRFHADMPSGLCGPSQWSVILQRYQRSGETQAACNLLQDDVLPFEKFAFSWAFRLEYSLSTSLKMNIWRTSGKP